MITMNYAGNAFSQDFIDAVNAQMVEYDAKLYDDGSPVDCSIMRMTLTLGGCSESDEGFQIGEVYASSLTATLHGLAGSLTGHELDVLIGVNTGSAYEYAQVATVVVTSSKAKGAFTAIQAAGKLAYACTNVPIGTSGELTPAEVAAAILAASGIPVTIGQFASTTTVTVTADMTCRAALAATAKRLGGYACETNAGGAAIMPFSSTSTYTLDPEDMTRYPDLEESDYTVDGITVQASEAEYTFGTGRVVIADPNATAETAAVTWGNVSGYSFRQGSANTAILDPRVTPFDVLAIGTATMPARGISATYDGGYFGVFSALGLTDEGEAAHFKGAIAEQVDAAERAANEAKAVAEATSQHFWPYDDGAHVTGPETQDEFLAAEAAGFPDYDPTAKPYHNILLNSLGILLRTALNNLVSITRSAIAFYDGAGNAASNIVARFGSDGAQIGKSTGQHVVIDQDSLDIMNGEATLATFGETAVVGQRNTAGSMNIFLGKNEGYNPGITEIIRWVDRTSLYSYFQAIHDRNNGNDYVIIGYGGGTYPGYGQYSVALGSFSWQTAGSFGKYSIAEGKDSRAGGEASHAQNLGTIAAKRSQTAIGTYNEEDTSSTTTHPSGDARYGDYALIVGNGTDDSNRSNAFTIDWDGNGEFAGAVSAVSASENYNDGEAGATIAMSKYRRDTAPSANRYPNVLLIEDADGELYGALRLALLSNGTNAVALEAERTVNGTRTSHTLQLRIAADGTRTVNLSVPDAWRNALGASSGIWPVALGGSGNSGTQMASSGIFEVNSSNASLVSQEFARWGKLLTVNICINLKAALSTGNGNITNINVGTIADGFRPSCNTCAVVPDYSGTVNINTNGAVNLASFLPNLTIPTTANLYIRGTYVLA